MFLPGKAEWLRRMYYPNGQAFRSLARGIANMTGGNWGATDTRCDTEM